jgi:predicted nucleic acid-binding protein
MFVLDNSVTARWLFLDGGKKDIEYADRVMAEIERSRAMVPVTWSLEVANVISRGESAGILHPGDSDKFIQKLDRMNIAVDHATHEKAFVETLKLSRKYRLTSYDASYLELSLRHGVPIATLDKALRRAAVRSGVEILLG